MSKRINFTGRQIAAARELVGIDQKVLAHAAGISAPTLRRMELSTGIAGGILNNLLAVQRALEDAGAVFTSADKDGGAGGRIKSPESQEGLTRKIDTL